MQESSTAVHDVNYPSSADILAVEPSQADEWVDFTFIRDDPMAWRHDGVAFEAFRRTASKGLGIDANGIFCLGSGALGWSLNPDNMTDGALKAFDSDSDLDMAFISEVYFEAAWRAMRKAEQKMLSARRRVVAEDRSLNFQRRKFFDGAIVANDDVGRLPFGPLWVRALPRLRGMANDAVGRTIKLNFFIYRDYWSVHNAVAKSLYVCQAKGIASGD